jgi:predicted RNase H-like nuclease (RuvC/YqgF family)
MVCKCAGADNEHDPVPHEQAGPVMSTQPSHLHQVGLDLEAAQKQVALLEQEHHALSEVARQQNEHSTKLKAEVAQLREANSQLLLRADEASLENIKAKEQLALTDNLSAMLQQQALHCADLERRLALQAGVVSTDAGIQCAESFRNQDETGPPTGPTAGASLNGQKLHP